MSAVSMIHLMIDGRTVEVVAGSTLLAAARKLGIDVPALCYLPGCKPNTACMACVMRRRDDGRIVPSCATPAEEGLAVESETDEIRGLRRVALELMLSDHPLAESAPEASESEAAGPAAPAPEVANDPPMNALDNGVPQPPPAVRCANDPPMNALDNGVPQPPPAVRCANDPPMNALDTRTTHCDSAAVCRLRKYALAYGADPRRFAGARRHADPDHLRRVGSHPEISFDPGRCILCGLCVQLARDAGEPLGLALTGRGFETRVDVPLGGELSDALTTSARRCAGACPTGALRRRAEP